MLPYLALPPSGFCVRAPQKCTEYAEGCKPSDRVIQYFWTVLKDFSQAERVLYLRFVWGRSRLPVSRSAFDRLHRVRWHACCLYPFVCLRIDCLTSELSLQHGIRRHVACTFMNSRVHLPYT